ncbi:F-box domain-containing protein [Orpheovirus IHUMI-LCC2]|uniref:F-box domain-containing protein n=1 Tax=Orpheovirus IHUMI-LCC2 TaxID=2023057 RepID=A0A2I2L3C8_9VIRU|nr:F-box domain-containing protein [Orpheovirus IHUMI-LCC2]SNW61979.1 F-box domain-containing protein [Orpheovirus IHUMI-LCC2]
MEVLPMEMIMHILIVGGPNVILSISYVNKFYNKLSIDRSLWNSLLSTSCNYIELKRYIDAYKKEYLLKNILHKVKNGGLVIKKLSLIKKITSLDLFKENNSRLNRLMYNRNIISQECYKEIKHVYNTRDDNKWYSIVNNYIINDEIIIGYIQDNKYCITYLAKESNTILPKPYTNSFIISYNLFNYIVSYIDIINSDI